MADKIILKDGWGYCEVQEATIKKKDGSMMTDSKGNLLMMLRQIVTDSEGNISYASDFVGAAYAKKIANIENSFGVKGLHSERGFDTRLLIGKGAGCIIGHKDDPKYGVQNIIKSYVPASFFKLMTMELPENKNASQPHKYESANKQDVDLEELPF